MRKDLYRRRRNEILYGLFRLLRFFEYSLIRNAHEKIRCGNMEGITDDAMVVERASGAKISLAEGSYKNLKITTPEDLDIAEIFLKNI